MIFRLRQTVRHLYIPNENVYTYVVNDNHKITVDIRAPNKDECEKGHKAENSFCTSKAEINPSPKNMKVFVGIAENQFDPGDERSAFEYNGENGIRIRLPTLSRMPEAFQSFLNQVHHELSNAIKLVVNSLRWRANLLGPHQTFSSSGLSWSFDGKFWHWTPSDYEVILSDTTQVLRVNESIGEDVKKFVREKKQEPVCHELFREAWEQKISNPRSSLLVGLSALEVAVKTAISSLNPDSTWLVENLPSPPVLKIINDYIPKLSVENKINGKIPRLPKKLDDEIKKAVTIRNSITHIGAKPPSYERLYSMLSAIRDVIWLLEYYRGYAWAYSHISQETRDLFERK